MRFTPFEVQAKGAAAAKGSLSATGFSTLEVVLAMAILIVVLTAVVLVSFGNQTALVDSQTNAEALSRVQAILECAQAQARKDFRLVAPGELTTHCPELQGGDPLYTRTVDVVQVGYSVKQVTADVTWPAEHGRNLSVQLSTLVTDFNDAAGKDSCNAVLTGNWLSPQLAPSVLVGNLNSSDTSAKIALDVYHQSLYAALSNVDTDSAPTLFVYNLSDPLLPALLNARDNAGGVKAGLSAVQAAGTYLYAAKNTGPGSGQLQVFDISGASLAQVGSDYKIPASIVSGTGGQAAGNSLFYKDGYVYLGLTATASGPEFNVIDVHDPLNPTWVGGYALGNDVNAIYVRDGYVYLATPNDHELIVLNVSNPTSPQLVGRYNATGGSGNGKSVYTVGDKLYLGRTTSAESELYVLDVTAPASDPLPLLGTPQEIGSSVTGLIVRDFLAFLLTTKQGVTAGQLQLWQVADPANITSYAPAISLPGTGSGTALDCESNYLYAGYVASSTGYLAAVGAL